MPPSLPLAKNIPTKTFTEKNSFTGLDMDSGHLFTTTIPNGFQEPISGTDLEHNSQTHPFSEVEQPGLT